jgi:NitT/TauT family transport system ATP-binding protein
VAVTSEKALLTFEQASRVFPRPGQRGVEALANLTFSLRNDEFLCVIGPSGCGKSTLLRLAAGLDSPTEGRILFSGEPLQGPGRERGMVFQSYNAFPWLTVRENIGFGLSRENGVARRAKVERWLKATGLSDFADSYPKALSGGMRQRLALARTLVMEPELLLLDEPFGALDEPVRRSMQSTLTSIVGELGCGVLFVTHDISEAVLLGDKVMLLSPRPGRILEIFPVDAPRPRRDDFIASAEFAELYERILTRFPNSLAGDELQ